jgi:hypothetical protein
VEQNDIYPLFKKVDKNSEEATESSEGATDKAERLTKRSD